ncbi:MAG: glycerophosphodiester phosphodiesterase family protein [Spirochaetota bacterium]
MTPAFVRAAHAKNFKVEVWTLDDPELAKKSISWGIDGIDTDRPDVMKETIGGRRPGKGEGEYRRSFLRAWLGVPEPTPRYSPPLRAPRSAAGRFAPPTAWYEGS